MKVARQVAHVFPGGSFAWQFKDDEPISAAKYLLGLIGTFFPDKVDVFCPKGIPSNSDLAREDVLKLGRTIFKRFTASVLLILDHAETLMRAKANGNESAIALTDLFKEISAKILVTSQMPLEWPREKLMHLNGDMDSGHHLFIQNLADETRERMAKMAKENIMQNAEQLLQDLVTNVDGHPQSLILLGRGTSKTQHSSRPLEEIVHEYYSTIIAEEDSKAKSLEKHFGSMIDGLQPSPQRLSLFLYMCSLVTGPITTETLAFVSYFIDCVGKTDTEKARSFKDVFIKKGYVEMTGSRAELIDGNLESLEKSCPFGLFRKRENERGEYRIHVGFREALRQHNVELGVRLRLPITESIFDDAFVAGTPSGQGK
jgi:hypothetical protein